MDGCLDYRHQHQLEVDSVEAIAEAIDGPVLPSLAILSVVSVLFRTRGSSAGIAVSRLLELLSLFAGGRAG